MTLLHELAVLLLGWSAGNTSRVRDLARGLPHPVTSAILRTSVRRLAPITVCRTFRVIETSYKLLRGETDDWIDA